MKDLAEKQSRSGQPSLATEKRRSPRNRLAKPLEVAWHTGDGTYLCLQAETLDVSRHGSLLKMETAVPAHEVVALRGGSVEWRLARVVRCDPASSDGRTPVAVEWAEPEETPWIQVA